MGIRYEIQNIFDTKWRWVGEGVGGFVNDFLISVFFCFGVKMVTK